VTIDKEPQRLVSLASSNTELVYAADLQDRLVGVDDYSDYPPEAKNKEKVGGFAKPNIEKIVSLAPDLVLATQIHTKGVVDDLEKRGLKVVVIQPAKLEQIPENLLLLGQLTGRLGQAEKVAGALRQRIQTVTTKVANAPKVRVFFELSPDLISVGRDSFLDDMIEKAGGESVSRDTQGAWPKLNPEVIVAKDPQVIILADHGSDSGGVTAEMVRERPGWAMVSAVKDNRIVLLPNQDITNRPGPRAVDGLEFLAQTLHPELFTAR
jgi:iron complex transport system substrate-binding protein